MHAASRVVQRTLHLYRQPVFQLVAHVATYLTECVLYLFRMLTGCEAIGVHAVWAPACLEMSGALVAPATVTVLRRFTCAIRKDKYLGRYGLAAIDPYVLSLEVLVEIFCFDVGAVSEGGIIVAEGREPTLDRGLELAWANIRVQGTRRFQGRIVEDRISSLTLRDKRSNIAGLQLADLVVSPIGRHILGKSDKEDWEIVNGKFRRSPRGRVENYGLVVLPR